VGSVDFGGQIGGPIVGHCRTRLAYETTNSISKYRNERSCVTRWCVN
jgi:hypothetical protein